MTSAHVRPIDHDSAAFESLESRSLLSAPFEFAAVGIRYDAGSALFFTQGTIAADDTITGTTQLASIAGAGAEQSIDWTRYNRGEGDARATFSFDTRDGFGSYASQSGTRFLRDERRDLGTFIGRDMSGAVRDFAVLLQKDDFIVTNNDVRQALGDGLQLQMMRLTDAGAIETFTLNVMVALDVPFGGAGEFTFSYEFASGTVTAMRRSVSFENGVLTLDGGERIVFNGSRDSVLLTDFDNTDGILGVASGRVRIGSAQQNGFYRAAVVINGPQSAAFFGVDPMTLGPNGTVADIVIELHTISLDTRIGPTNEFRIYRASDFDAGMRSPLTSGYWIERREFVPAGGLISTRLQLYLSEEGEVFNENTFVFVRGGGGRSIHFDELRTSLDAHEELFGVGSTSYVNGNQIAEFQAHVDPDGRPFAHIDVRFNADLTVPSIYVVDLIDEVGGEAVVGDLVSWASEQGGHFWAGLSASGEVQVWQFSAIGFTYRNLTQTAQFARPIVGQLAYTSYNTDSLASDLWKNQTLGGFDADGNFIVYQQLNGFVDNTVMNWLFSDVSDAGVGVPPEFVSDLVGWSSGWGAIHFAGLDADGEIWAMWWSPILTQWQVTNITGTVPGGQAAPLVVNLSVVRTPWDTFHINGTDASGNVTSTWWAPGFSAWRVEYLSVQFGGPALTPGSITSNFSPLLNTFNIVGRGVNDRPIAYWWTPEFRWQIDPLGAGIAQQFIPIQPWVITSSSVYINLGPDEPFAHSQSLLGRNSDGRLVRLLWRSDGVDAWNFQDITNISQPYFL